MYCHWLKETTNGIMGLDEETIKYSNKYIRQNKISDNQQVLFLK